MKKRKNWIFVPHYEIWEGDYILYKDEIFSVVEKTSDYIRATNAFKLTTPNAYFVKLPIAGAFKLVASAPVVLHISPGETRFCLDEYYTRKLIGGESIFSQIPGRLITPGVYDAVEPCALVEIPYNGPNTDDMPMPETVQGYVYRYDQGADGGEYDWISPAQMPADAVRLRVKVTKTKGGYKLSPVK